MSFDIVFISYDEEEADYNYSDLLLYYPSAKRVHGVEGIREAHKKAATISSTDFFYTIDGDNRFIKDKVLTPPQHLDKDAVYVWRCENPVNELVYGYGGIKLWHKNTFSNELGKYKDHAMSATQHYIIINELVTQTHYNTSAFSSWRAGFREAIKLTHNVEQKVDNVSKTRLDGWLEKGSEKLFGKESMLGAKQGREFYLNTSNKDSVFSLINDFNQLFKHYKEINRI